MKCPMCDGMGKSEIGVGAFTIHGADCDRCNGKGVIEPLTNEEYIRSCSTEELAKTLYDIRFDFQTPWKNKEITEWLKEKHEPLKTMKK